MVTPLPEAVRARLEAGETGTRFLVEGRHAVRALLESGGFPVEAVVATGRVSGDLLDLADRRQVPVFAWSREEAADRLGFTFHRGVLAIARKPEREFSNWCEAASPRRLVAIENLADPGNVGTVIRNAAAFDFDAVLCLAGGASPYNAKSVRASATGIFSLPVFEVGFDSLDWLVEARKAHLVGTSLSAGAEPFTAETGRRLREGRERPLVLLLGNEAEGLSEASLARCHERVGIPISGRVESLNVASASAILLHALRPGD